jgi:hypothetical protein
MSQDCTHTATFYGEVLKSRPREAHFHCLQDLQCEQRRNAAPHMAMIEKFFENPQRGESVDKNIHFLTGLMPGPARI